MQTPAINGQPEFLSAVQNIHPPDCFGVAGLAQIDLGCLQILDASAGSSAIPGGRGTIRLPEAGEEAVAHQGNIGRPSGILREHPLLGVNAVEQGCPSRHYQQHSAGIPFLEVVPDVRKHVGQIHWMAHEPIGATCLQIPQGREDPEPSAQADEAGEAQTRCERHEKESTRWPRWVAGHPPKIHYLGVRVGIRYDDGGAGGQRDILHFGRAPRERDPENQEVL